MKGRLGTVALPKSPYHLMPLGLSKCACMCEYVRGCCVGLSSVNLCHGCSLCVRKQEAWSPSSVELAVCCYLSLCLTGL